MKKWNWMQQVKAVLVGATAAFAANKLGLGAEAATAVGAVVGSAFDALYFALVAKKDADDK